MEEDFCKHLEASTKSLREQAIETMGYTVIELDGWVVRDYGDGRAVEKISKIEKAKRPEKLILD